MPRRSAASCQGPDNSMRNFGESNWRRRERVNPSAHRCVGLVPTSIKLSANQGAQNLNRDGGNAGVFSSRCTIMGQTGRETRPQGREVVQGIWLRSGAPFAGSRATFRCDQPVWTQRGGASRCQGARRREGGAGRNMQSLRTMRDGNAASHAAAPWDMTRPIVAISFGLASLIGPRRRPVAW